MIDTLITTLAITDKNTLTKLNRSITEIGIYTNIANTGVPKSPLIIT
jgi:hypothetical protein